MRFEVYFTKKAMRQLDDLNPQARKRLLNDLVMLRDYGFTPRLDIKKLRGYKNHYRLRIGKHRILIMDDVADTGKSLKLVKEHSLNSSN